MFRSTISSPAPASVIRPRSPENVYRILFRRFGPQGWWPVAPHESAKPAYHPGRYRRPDEDEAVEIALGAILTQNTAWTNVEKAIVNLHRQSPLAPPSPRRGEGGGEGKPRGAGPSHERGPLRVILEMPRARLERLIRPSGYFRQKAARLREFLRHVTARGGKLTAWLGGPLAAVREDLLSVRGIGPETADSILLYAAGRPAFVVDAYTLRIGRRLGWYGPVGYDGARDFLTSLLPRSTVVYQEFHALLVALAKFYCRVQPLCGGCPLLEGCRYGLSRSA